MGRNDLLIRTFLNVEPIADQHAAEQYVIDEYNKLKARLRESAMG
nr:hypothetical protein [Enterobacter roggenkampii]